MVGHWKSKRISGYRLVQRGLEGAIVGKTDGIFRIVLGLSPRNIAKDSLQIRLRIKGILARIVVGVIRDKDHV